MSSLPCFFSSTGFLRPKSFTSSTLNFPVCNIIDRSIDKTKTPLRAANSPPKKDKGSEFYRAIPESTENSDLPPPPPFYRSIPVFGFLIEEVLNLNNDLNRARKYDGIYSSDFFLSRAEFVTDMRAIVDILRDADTFRSKDSNDSFRQLFGGDAMVLLDAPDHAAVRNTIAPAFASGLFPFYFDAIRDRTRRMWARVERTVAEKGRVLLDPIFREHYLSIIVEMSSGIDMDRDDAEFIQENFLTMQQLVFTPPWGPLYSAGTAAKEKILARLASVVEKNLVEKADTISRLREYGDNLSYKGSKDIKNGDVNVLLIAIARSGLKTGREQNKNPEEIKDLCNLILLIWFAGFATSAATTSCAAFEMGLNQDIWSQLVAEQDGIVTKAGSETVTYEQANTQMPLLDSYITEILRMRPALPFLSRKTTKDLEILGYYVKAGSVVSCDFSSAMRDEAMYPDPDTLKVDRFVKKPGKPSPPRVISFGGPGNPHHCIGAALSKIVMKTTLAVLLREYRLEMDPKQSRAYAKVPEEIPKSKVVVTSVEKRSPPI